MTAYTLNAHSLQSVEGWTFAQLAAALVGPLEELGIDLIEAPLDEGWDGLSDCVDEGLRADVEALVERIITDGPAG